MLELWLLCVLVLALRRALALRHAWALSCGGAALYLLLADVLAAIASDVPQPVAAVFNLFLLGPGSAMERAPGWLPLPAVLLSRPLLLRGLRIALCAAASWRCLHQASQLNPLLPRAYALDAIGLPFAGTGVLDTVTAVILLYASQLSARPF